MSRDGSKASPEQAGTTPQKIRGQEIEDSKPPEVGRPQTQRQTQTQSKQGQQEDNNEDSAPTCYSSGSDSEDKSNSKRNKCTVSPKS